MTDTIDSRKFDDRDPSKPHFVDPVQEFEKARSRLDQNAVQALANLGSEAITAYGSVLLYHNTLHTLLPSILTEGLRADSEPSTPSPEDIEFAERLFIEKGDYDSNSASRFDRYIKGSPRERKPGVFFYGLKPEKRTDYNRGYGQPERLTIFTQEMGSIMLNESGKFTDEEREKARSLFNKYLPLAIGDGFISVIQANPFSPPIFNERLARLHEHDPHNPHLIDALKRQGTTTFEGIYIPDSIPPEDLAIVEETIPLSSHYDLSEDTLKTFHSRFF